MDNSLNIIKDETLDLKQKTHALACEAENSLPYVDISEEAHRYLEEGLICDLFEGHAPYKPRYVLPDYKNYFANGSEYLNIEPPKDMYEAINALLIIYQYVPSVTGYPVFLGDVDKLLQPFVNTVTDQELENLLRMFLINIDRTLPDSFVHMDIGPEETKVGNLVLDLEKELKKAVPNISLRINEKTSDDLIKKAVETALEVGKPYFINDEEIRKDLGENYGIASCYNSLKLGGGSFTLVRLNLKEVAKKANDIESFIEEDLKKAIDLECEIIDARIKFLVEESKFFQNSFFAKEKIISIDNFTAMAAVFGLYECVEVLTDGLKVGKDEEALVIAERIIKKAREYVKAHDSKYCYGLNGKIGFHAQSGIDSDIDVTAGVRIKIGEEPDILDQIIAESKLQKYFDTGVSDIYNFDATAKNNIEGVVKVVKGALDEGLKIFCINTSDSDLIRITGYLVKKKDIEKYNNKEIVRETTAKFGAASIDNNNILNRPNRKI
ncbi:YjjI family glycine radical enzyme [Clostridium sp. DL1XJH146]